MKNPTVVVETKPRLALRGLVEVGLADWRLRDVVVPVDEAVLTRPVRDEQGDFLRAELRHGDEVRWRFGKNDWEFYLKVELALAQARKGQV